MEHDHKLWISMRFDALELPPIEVLDIPDQFGVMDPELQVMLRSLLDPEIERLLESHQGKRKADRQPKRNDGAGADSPSGPPAGRDHP